MSVTTVSLPTLHPGQCDVLARATRFTVLCCGRRFGKTVFGIERACDELLGTGKRYVAWFAPNYKYLTEVWAEMKTRLGPLIERKDEDERRLELKDGSVFECWSLDGKDDVARGRKYHLVIVDEAGMVQNLLGIWHSAIRPTLTDFRGRALLLGTPKGRKHGFVHLLELGMGGGDPEWSGFRKGTVDNPYIPADEVEAARRSMPYPLFAQEYLGIPLDDGTHPIGLEAIAAACGPRSTLPVVAWGLDLARAADWTVLVGLDAFGRWARVERWQSPWSVTKDRILRTVGRDTPVVADATGVGDGIVDDLQRNGLNVSRFVFTTRSKRELVERLISAIHNKHISLPPVEDATCGWLTAELNALEVTQLATGPRYAAPTGLHDDGVFALALAVRCHDATPLPEWLPQVPLADGRDPNRLVVEGGLAVGAVQRDDDADDFGSLGTGW